MTEYVNHKFETAQELFEFLAAMSESERGVLYSENGDGDVVRVSERTTTVTDGSTVTDLVFS